MPSLSRIKKGAIATLVLLMCSSGFSSVAQARGGHGGYGYGGHRGGGGWNRGGWAHGGWGHGGWGHGHGWHRGGWGRGYGWGYGGWGWGLAAPYYVDYSYAPAPYYEDEVVVYERPVRRVRRYACYTKVPIYNARGRYIGTKKRSVAC